MAEFFPIVGIGSSAGGLEALQKLFGAIPSDSGFGFVVAAHLDPTQESHLTELVARCTKMPVVQIEKTIKINPDHVYVIAPDQELSIKAGVLHSDKPRAPRGHRHPVDSFFRSLAEDQGERAVAIVLSGTGSDGSLGLRFIKAEGGIAIAQDPESAAFPGMPRSAIGTGIVDLVLPPEKIPEALLGLARHFYVQPAAEAVEEAAPEVQLNILLALLHSQTRRDFNGYRRGTLLRRIHRRMGLHRISGLRHYIERLRRDANEVEALIGDLTINVTGFFRDPEAWDALAEKVIAPLAQERPTHSAIRAWVPGCSTGEEAYSIAMLVSEQADAVGKSFDLRLFATDVAQATLSAARAGQYPKSISLDISQQRLQRFFERQEDTYCVRKSIRETITFAPQNLLQDPPFSRLDLISCRNLFIYLEPDVQKRALGLFHLALREGGHLFLGSAETMSGQEDLFQPVSKKWRIFRRIGSTRHDVVDFSLLGGSRSATSGDSKVASAQAESQVRSGELMMQALVDRYAPASVLIDAQHRVHYLHGPTGDYLQPASGEPSHNLLAMARERLQMPLRTAVRKALAENREITTRARVRRGGTMHPVRLIATPLKAGGGAPNRLLVGFVDHEDTGESATPTPSDEVLSERQLQAELDSAREDHRLALAELGAANEDLKASNEEIRSINEELQATNEELETSKEELQSLNEELNTVNNQLQAKVGELEERTADLNNLLNSTDIATLFLDRALCIRWFTPAMKGLYDLVPTDIGRPISHLAQRFSGGDLAEDVERVLAKLTPTDTEVVNDQSRWYQRHIAPYRTIDDRIDGVVVTFADVTACKQAEQQVHDAKVYAEKIVDTVREPLLVLSPGLTVQSANESFYRWFRVAPEETEGQPIFELGNRQWDIPELRQLLEDVLPANNQFNDFEVEHEFETLGRRTMLLNGRRLDHVQLILLAIEDVTDRKRAEAGMLASEERLRRVLETATIGVLFFNESGTLLDANDVFLRTMGYSRGEVESRELTWRSMTPAEWVEVSLEQWNRLQVTGRIGPYEKEYLRKDGSRSWMLCAGASFDADTIVEFCIDINDRKRAEAERELLAQELSHRVKNTLAVVQALARQTDVRGRSVEAYREAFLGRLQAMARAHSLLLDRHWLNADLKALAEEAVAAYRVDHPDAVKVEGDPVNVTAKQGLGLSLVLHELGTNAVKYGALSRHEGRLRISWQVENYDQSRRVRLDWRERHGPQVEPPAETSFGTKLIKQACAYELDGKAELDFAPEGLICTIVFPLG